MMLSLREATQKAGFNDSVISLQSLAPSFGLGPNLSLQALIGDLIPEQVTFETGDIKAGDVKGWGELTLFSNGYWMFKGHLHDSGTIVGDHYVFAMTLNYVDGSGEAITVKKDGKLGAAVGGSRNVDWDEQGRDQRIAANWPNIVSKGVSHTLKVDPDLGKLASVIFEILGTIGAVAAYFLLAGHSKDCIREYDAVTDREVIRCRVQR